MAKNTKYQILNTKYNLTIGWLYPELMSTYGDRGNIIVLQKRCEWRGIKVEVKRMDLGFRILDLKACDMLFMGGAQDQQQQIVAKDLKEKKKALLEMIEDGTPGLYICGAYQFLGKYYKETDGTIIDGLGIFDLYTESPGINHPRLIGNIATSLYHLFEPETQSRRPELSRNCYSKPSNCHPELVSGSRDSDLHQNDNNKTLVGFENHGGRTYLGKNIKPLAEVVVGFGNNGTDKTEGAIYKNSFGTYLHGPILPKNPHFADHLIKLALEKKYKKEIKLESLDDSLELQAHKAILKKLDGDNSF